MALSTRLTDTGLGLRAEVDALEVTTGTHTTELAQIGKVYDINGEVMVNIWIGTQAEYDALSPDANTIYMITEVV